MRNTIIAVIVLGAGFFYMRSQGWTFSDVLAYVKGDIAQARSDSRDLMSGEYSERISRELRDGAAKMPAAQGGEGVGAELNRELAAERKRMMEERARAAQETGAQVLKGDTETLKRQVRQNAQQAGGTQ